MCIRDSLGSGKILADAALLLPRQVGQRLDEIAYDRRLGRHCLLYTSDAADERSSVDLGGSRIINKKPRVHYRAIPYNVRKQQTLPVTNSKQPHPT